MRALSGPQEGSKRGPSEPLEFEAKTSSALLGCLLGPLRQPRKALPGSQEGCKRGPSEPFGPTPRPLPRIILDACSEASRAPRVASPEPPNAPRRDLLGPSVRRLGQLCLGAGSLQGLSRAVRDRGIMPRSGPFCTHLRFPLFLLVLLIPLFLLATQLSPAAGSPPRRRGASVP